MLLAISSTWDSPVETTMESIDELSVEFNDVLEKGRTDYKQGGQIQLKPSICWKYSSSLL